MNSKFVLSIEPEQLNGIALGYGVDDRGFEFGQGNFSIHHSVQAGSGAHSTSYIMDNGDLFLGVKRPVLDADHSPPSSAEAKECVLLYLHFPNKLSWPGVQLKYGLLKYSCYNQ